MSNQKVKVILISACCLCFVFIKMSLKFKLLSVAICLFFNDIVSISLKDINVPHQHIKYLFNSFEELVTSCVEDSQCPHNDLIGIKACWGYEDFCNVSASYDVRSTCPGDHRGWVKTKQAQFETFYTQADFGKIFIYSL